MKKLIMATLLLCCQFMYAEYAIIDKIVYSVHFNSLTATVVNFQTNTSTPCDVTIPETIRYKNDTYKVTGLSYYAFNYSAMSYYQEASMLFGAGLASAGLNNAYKREQEESKYQYNYEEARANIEHLNLPNTLTYIVAGAFTGMKRLKTLVIPASVKTLNDVSAGYLLDGSKGRGSYQTYPRLESITILGTPTFTICSYHGGSFGYNPIYDSDKEINAYIQNANGDFIYVSKLAFVVANIDSRTNSSQMCPNLKSFSVPYMEKAIEEAKLCKEYNSQLETICAEYNSRLKTNIYYDGSMLKFTPIQFGTQPEAMTDSLQSKKEKLAREFSTLDKGQMERNLRANDINKYIQCYVVAHPEKKALIDSVRLEYRCYSNSDNEILDAIEGRPISTQSCREKQYLQYQNLFSDMNDFNSRYNLASSDSVFQSEISTRNEVIGSLRSFTEIIKNNPKENIQGMSAAKIGSFPYRINMYIKLFKESYYYENAQNVVFEYNQHINKEYNKNGQYFDNPNEFFEAYSSSEYKTILKDKKNVK